MCSLANLQVDQLDTLLIHFPGAPDAVQSPAANRKIRQDTWRALERLQADGRVREIGVRLSMIASLISLQSDGRVREIGLRLAYDDL